MKKTEKERLAEDNELMRRFMACLCEDERNARTRLLRELCRMEEACGELRLRLLRYGEPLSEDRLKFHNWEIRNSQCYIDGWIRTLLEERKGGGVGKEGGSDEGSVEGSR